MVTMIENETMWKTEVLESDKPVLVDFFATWCGPCKMLSPLVDEVAAENTTAVKVVKLDIDENMEIAEEYGVMAVPTLMVFKNGEPAAQSVGVVPKDKIEALIK